MWGLGGWRDGRGRGGVVVSFEGGSLVARLGFGLIVGELTTNDECFKSRLMQLFTFQASTRCGRCDHAGKRHS